MPLRTPSRTPSCHCGVRKTAGDEGKRVRKTAGDESRQLTSAAQQCSRLGSSVLGGGPAERLVDGVDGVVLRSSSGAGVSARSGGLKLHDTLRKEQDSVRWHTGVADLVRLSPPFHITSMILQQCCLPPGAMACLLRLLSKRDMVCRGCSRGGLCGRGSCGGRTSLRWRLWGSSAWKPRKSSRSTTPLFARAGFARMEAAALSCAHKEPFTSVHECLLA